MSVEIVVSLICDGCGTRITGIQHTTCGGLHAYWNVKRSAKIHHWVRLPRRYGKPRDFCGTCADKPTPKIVPRGET